MHSGTRLLSYAQLLDSALPIGGFSHSFGLESYVQEGLITTIGQLESYISGQIHSSLARFDGIAIKGIYDALDRNDIRALCTIDTILHVQRSPRESRDGLYKMGRRLLRLASSLYPCMDVTALEAGLQEYNGFGVLPTVHAWIGYHLEIPCDDAVLGYLYTSTVMAVNSAMRLMPIGQTEGQVLIRRMMPVLEEQWREVEGLAFEQMHTFALAQEIRAMNHETLYSRLFMS